jgi:dipeptidyl-peptidase-4
MSKAMSDAVKLGSLAVTWKDGGQALEYRRDGKRYRFDLATRQTTEVTNTPPSAKTDTPAEKPRPKAHDDDDRPDRGRQFRTAYSPDGKHKAFYRDHNLWLTPTETTNAVPVTTEGNAKARLKFGIASWVYGEELEQKTAIWWSPDNRKVAFYRFDESRVPDFFLQMDQTKILSTVDIEPYAKAGGNNPLVDILIYDLESKQTVTVDVRDGQPFENSVIGHYVYDVAWTKDGRELLFHRTNRRQNIMELAAANPETGKCRVVVREAWLPSWTENSPLLRFFEDGRRFIWASERTGWRNFYLYDLQDGLRRPLTDHAFEVGDIERLDEAAGWFYYTARDGDNPMKLQLHRVRLDGTADERLTDPAFHHQIDFAPDGRHFIDVAQTHDQPPTTVVRDAEGQWVAELAKSDMTKFRQLGLRTAELLRFKAADGRTDLYGLLHFPSNFSPRKKYPLLVSVYAGPATTGARETFVMPSRLAELGFLVASFDARSASGRGKQFLDAIYGQLGIVEMDDQAAGVRALWPRRYVDRGRVGIFGTSYGGTSAATCLLRFPEVFQAACANSAVTDHRNYDTIYAERYMGTPQDNPAAYDAARIMNYATNLQGRLMLFYGTADNNVHPNNTMQLVEALQKAGKSFDLQVGPDYGHTAVNQDRMMEFFIENLVLRRPEPPPPPKPAPPEPKPTRRPRTTANRHSQ